MGEEKLFFQTFSSLEDKMCAKITTKVKLRKKSHHIAIFTIDDKENEDEKLERGRKLLLMVNFFPSSFSFIFFHKEKNL